MKKPEQPLVVGAKESLSPASEPVPAKKPELLAPAGGPEQLEAALLFGADAIYLATEKFGMRARAANFALDALPEVVRKAHAADARVYVTCNILMNDADIAELPAYFSALENAGVDAVIIGDMGAARVLRTSAPNLALHVSTQASVANTQAARAWYELGASRIVCAREMSLEQISAMRASLSADLEIEAFVHGAQCMAVSGRCLISSYLANRSGNRGHCTQPCRWNYALEEEKRPGEFFGIEEGERGTYIMNAKDLNMLSHVEKLAQAGIDSLKIEGRNKKAFYVATVVGAYRRVLDGENAADVANELETISHRPYSTGFYFGQAEQASTYDGYEQTCIHVADVLSCTPVCTKACTPASKKDTWALEVRLRNKFSEGDTLEVLRPRKAYTSLVVKNLCWLPEEKKKEEEPFSSGAQKGMLEATGATKAAEPAESQLTPTTAFAPVPTAVANRASERYMFYTDKPLEPGCFLRIRQFRRSARSGAPKA